jgi:hypothetical protein
MHYSLFGCVPDNITAGQDLGKCPSCGRRWAVGSLPIRQPHQRVWFVIPAPNTEITDCHLCGIANDVDFVSTDTTGINTLEFMLTFIERLNHE